MKIALLITDETPLLFTIYDEVILLFKYKISKVRYKMLDNCVCVVAYHKLVHCYYVESTFFNLYLQ